MCSVLFFSCLYICVCVYLEMQVPSQECSSIRSGVCGSSYHCAPLLCIPAVIGVLAVWRPKTKNPQTILHGLDQSCLKKHNVLEFTCAQLCAGNLHSYPGAHSKWLPLLVFFWGSFFFPSRRRVTPVAGPIFRPLSTRSIEGFHFEDGLISRFYFVPNPSNLVSQGLLCARRFHTLNRGISFRRIQILLSSFWKRDRENVFYKCSNLGQMFLRYWKSFPTKKYLD